MTIANKRLRVKPARLVELGYKLVGCGFGQRYVHPEFQSYTEYDELGYLIEEESPKGPPTTTGAVKSDGGSSSYYELELNGNSVQTEEIIEQVFGNDFDLGNMFKALVRIQASLNGGGKAGTTIEYDLNKIIYTCKKLKDRYATILPRETT